MQFITPAAVAVQGACVSHHTRLGDMKCLLTLRGGICSQFEEQGATTGAADSSWRVSQQIQLAAVNLPVLLTRQAAVHACCCLWTLFAVPQVHHHGKGAVAHQNYAPDVRELGQEYSITTVS